MDIGQRRWHCLNGIQLRNSRPHYRQEYIGMLLGYSEFGKRPSHHPIKFCSYLFLVVVDILHSNQCYQQYYHCCKDIQIRTLGNMDNRQCNQHDHKDIHLCRFVHQHHCIQLGKRQVYQRSYLRNKQFLLGEQCCMDGHWDPRTILGMGNHLDIVRNMDKFVYMLFLCLCILFYNQDHRHLLDMRWHSWRKLLDKN